MAAARLTRHKRSQMFFSFNHIYELLYNKTRTFLRDSMNIRDLVRLTLFIACLICSSRAFGQVSTSQPPDEVLRDSKPADFNRSSYYKNKLEFSVEAGWLPINIPFVFDF